MPDPALLVVTCGGTISSVPPGTGSGAVPRLQAGDLLGELPRLAAEVETHAFSTVASPELTLDDAVALHALLTAWVDARGDADAGIVVTCGTDTLEEMAYAVDLLWARQTPVVFTGAMRHAGLPSPDGPGNLLAASRTALAPSARGSGVLVVLGERIHLACTVRKSHTSDVGTFASPALGPVGWVAEGRPRLVLRRVRPRALPPPIGPVPAVALLTASLGDDGRLLPAVAAAGFAGLVLEALGGGHLPSAVAASDGLKGLVEAGPVVLASRVWAGEMLSATYGFAGSEADLLARGLISAGALDAPKARVLTALLLAAGCDRRGVAAGFAEHATYGA
ncbi:MAG TPA: asparaginase [Mycobacteriales bacterium]|nr:asparaginase [Mycobacteriales bacterium]